MNITVESLKYHHPSLIDHEVAAQSVKMADDEKEKAERSTQTYAALSVGFVCIIVGLPLWWKTTEVYRVQLPYREINTLAQTHVKYVIDFTAVVLDLELPEKDLALFGEKLKSQFDNIEKPNEGLSPGYRGQVRKGSDGEMEIFDKATDIKELDRLLNNLNNKPDHSKYQFILVPNNKQIQLARPWIGRHRRVFLSIDKDLDISVASISSIIRDVLVNEAAIAKAFYTAKGAVSTKADKESMRSLRSHPGYEVTFTLLNPEPEVVQAQWDVRGAIKEHMQPLLEAFAPYAQISVKSQYLHYTGLKIHPTKEEGSSTYKLTQDQLPHIINPIEAYLSSHVSTNPNLNFVLYVTPRVHYPLYIQDSTGEHSSSNSFLSPRWGGIMVYNAELPENSTVPAPVDIDMKKVLQVYLSQLRLLLGINPQATHGDVDIAQPGQAVVSSWELDQWLRLRTLESIATAISTLKSLAQLLEEISNIVINDDIGREVERAVSSIHKAHNYLQQAKLDKAFAFARQALLSSETAFFDPSLLELLYFPEDQKFAIYIPLFLPISIPVIMSVMQVFRKKTGKDKLKKE